MNNFQAVQLVQFNNRQAEMLQRLNKHVQTLSRHKTSREQDISDIEQSHILNLQTLKIMLQQNRTDKNIIKKVDQNINMLTLIREERRIKHTALAELLIHDQVQTQQFIFFHERMRTAEDRIEQQRKLIHQKQFYFSHVTQQLNNYQEPPEQLSDISIVNLEHVLLEQKDKKVLARLSRETEDLRKTSKNATKLLKSMKSNFRNSVQMLIYGQDYQKVLTNLTQKDQLRSQGHQKTQWQGIVLPDRQRMMPPLRNIHRQLLQIVKKQKQAQLILREQIKQSMVIGSEVRLRMQKLKTVNSNLDKQIQDYQNKISKLQNKLKQFTNGIKKDVDGQQSLNNRQMSEGSLRMEQRREIDMVPPEALMIKCSSEPDCSYREWAEEQKSTID